MWKVYSRCKQLQMSRILEQGRDGQKNYHFPVARKTFYYQCQKSMRSHIDEADRTVNYAYFFLADTPNTREFHFYNGNVVKYYTFPLCFLFYIFVIIAMKQTFSPFSTHLEIIILAHE